MQQKLECPVLDWTGERYVPQLKGPIQFEHLHRYALACEYSRGKVVLDIACGEGYGSAMLAETATKVIGVDISDAAVEHAKSRYAISNLEFIVSSCTKIPLADSSIDFVVSFETIEHHNEHDAMMKEFKRVLKPGGVLLISSPDKYEYSDVPRRNNEFHIKELYFNEFESLLKKYFKNVDFHGQRLVAGSAIFPQTNVGRVVTYTLDTEQNLKNSRFNGLGRPVYHLAFASDLELPDAIAGIMEPATADKSAEKLLVKNMKAYIESGSWDFASVVGELQKTIQEKDAEIKKIKTMMDSANISIEGYRGELYAVYVSRSWRYTWLLRKFGDWIRKLFLVLHVRPVRKGIKKLYFLLPPSLRYSGLVEKLKNRFKRSENFVK